MNSALLDRTTLKLKVLARSPIQAPSDDERRAWETSEPFRYDHQLIDALGRQLRAGESDFDGMWALLEEPFIHHIENVIRSPDPQAFEWTSKQVAQESFKEATRVELVQLFIDMGWQDFAPKGTVREFGGLFRTEAERRTARSIQQMLERWDRYDYWSVQWRKKPRDIDLRDRDDRRQLRADQAIYIPPAVPPVR